MKRLLSDFTDSVERLRQNIPISVFNVDLQEFPHPIKVKVKVKAAGNSKYKPVTKSVTFKIKVK